MRIDDRSVDDFDFILRLWQLKHLRGVAYPAKFESSQNPNDAGQYYVRPHKPESDKRIIMVRVSTDYYKGIADEIIGKIGRVNKFTNHGPSIDSYHEAVIRETLKKILPRRYSIRTGFVYHSSDSVSNQMDIMIIDENDSSAYLFREGDFAIVSPGAVVCAIEIKTRLNKKTFIETANNIYSVKKVAESAEMNPSRLVSLGFFFSGAAISTRNTDLWYRSTEVPNNHKYYPLGLYCLDKGYLQMFAPGNPIGMPWGSYLALVENPRKREAVVISMFMASVRSSAALRENADYNPFDLADMGEGDRVVFAGQYNQYGLGCIDPQENE